jgi:hypothetical protein
MAPNCRRQLVEPIQAFGLIQNRIDRLEQCRDLVRDKIDGILITIYIRALYQDLCNFPGDEAQVRFIQTVTNIILNGNLPDGIPLRQARRGQVESITRIVFRLGDTILIARTGYGKSLIFQAVSTILVDKVIIQIIPLSKLGEEQCEIIKRVPNSNPILIDTNVSKVDTISSSFPPYLYLFLRNRVFLFRSFAYHLYIG